MKFDPKTKCRMIKSVTKMIWQVNTLRGSATLAISMFCQAIPITRHFEEVLATKWSITSSFTNSAQFLKLLHLFNKNGPRNPPWYSHLVWIIPRWLHAICRSGATSLESNRCWSTNLSGRWMSILAKTFEQLMLWQDLTRQNNWGFSIESHLLIQLSSQFWNPR